MEIMALKPGQVIELELAKSKDEVMQFRTLVETVDGDTGFTLLAPMYKGMPYPFRDQDVVDVFYTVHDDDNTPHAFKFKARTVERYLRGDLSYLKIQRLSGITRLQRRGFYRLGYVADMEFQVLSEDDDSPSDRKKLITRDISAGGFRAVVSETLPPGTRMKLYLALGDEPIPMMATVISASRLEDSLMKAEIRCEFLGLSARDTAQLIQDINRMQSEYIRRMSAKGLEERLSEYGHDELLFSERRIGRDWVLKWLDWSVVLTWLLTFIIIVNFLLAMPQRPNTIQFYYGIPVRLEWDMTMIQRNIFFLLALFIVTSFSVILNATRMKRQEDHYRYTLVVMGVLSLLMLLVYILLF